MPGGGCTAVPLMTLGCPAASAVSAARSPAPLPAAPLPAAPPVAVAGVTVTPPAREDEVTPCANRLAPNIGGSELALGRLRVSLPPSGTAASVSWRFCATAGAVH